MNATLLFGCWNTLHAVHATLVFHPRIDAIALNEGDYFFQATDAGLRSIQHFDLPALSFRIARVHAKHLSSKKGSLVASGSRPDLQNHVFFIVGILRQQENLQFFFNLMQPNLQIVELLLGVGAYFRIFFVGQTRLAFRDPALQVLVLTILLHHRSDFAVRLRGLLVFARVADKLWRGEGLGQFLVPSFDLV